MTFVNRIIHIACASALLFVCAAAAAAETSTGLGARYTAQRKPRVTVLEFEDTNAAARNERYGASVQAMLVTFLKRKSQLVVVERQKLGMVTDEWKLNQVGQTNLQYDDPGVEEELLEKMDAIALGNVTLLKMTAETTVATDKEGRSSTRRGQRIEIDAKLLSRADGRIIAAAQRSGPVTCLRSIVERLGIALEQEFLRPYYGSLKIKLSDPENVRVLLTPILHSEALDEERPPVERGSTVIIGSERDIVEPWTTDPTTYTIENILSGWYSMRLERPGYEGLGTDNARWEVRDRYGRPAVYDRETDEWLRADSRLGRFVVHVDPLKSEVIDGDAEGFVFRKKGGSLTPYIKRQYLDEDYIRTPKMRVFLSGRSELEINGLDRPKEYAEDETCDLFEEQTPNLVDYGRTYIASGQDFDFENFNGGELIIEDYGAGTILPVGRYQVSLWEPFYELQRSTISVRDRDRDKPTRSTLVRSTTPLIVFATGPQPSETLTLAGDITGHHVEIPLDFTNGIFREGLPMDRYVASTDVPGLEGWRRSIDLLPDSLAPPVYDPKSTAKPPLRISMPSGGTKFRPADLRVKTRLCMGGQLSALGSLPDPTAEDIYIDKDIMAILDALLYPDDKDKARAVSRWGVSDWLKRHLLPSVPAVEQAAEPVATEGYVRVGGSESDAAEQGPTVSTMLSSTQSPELSRLPVDPEMLLELLSERLEDTDLLVLDDSDMARLLKNAEAAKVVSNFVASGGALFASVTVPGDYAAIVGARLVVEEKRKHTARFELSSGEVAGVDLRRQKKVKTKSKRALPKFDKSVRGSGWRVLAFTRSRKDPRIVERGGRDGSGYVLVWGDDFTSFRKRKGGTSPEIEDARAKVERRALDWARVLMYRRFDSDGEALSRAERAVAP